MKNIIAFDTETKGFSWWADETAFIATSANAEREFCFNLSFEIDREDFKQQLRDADLIVAHNLSFDVHQVRATLGFDILTETAAELHDTDLMARVLWPEGEYGEHGGFGLKNLAKVFLDPNADVDEDGIKQAAKDIGLRSLRKTGAYYDVWRAYPDVMEKYAKSDARYTYDLFQLLLKDYAKHEQRARIYDLEREVAPLVIQAEARGTRLNPPAVKRLQKQYLREQKALHKSLAAQLGDEALGGEGSEEALAEALLKNGVPLTERTETGKLAMHQGVFNRLAAEYPVVGELQDYRHVSKFLSTYIEPMLGRDVVHPNFRQIGAWTGRMSCMRPNMQNIPVRAGSEVRECFVARPGHKLVVIDFEQIEARVVAYYLGPQGQAWRDLINSGEDVHAHMAADLANEGVEPWTSAPVELPRPAHLTKPGYTPDDFDKHGPNGRLRSNARHTLFAILYGAGAVKICNQLGLPTGPPLTEKDWVVQKGYKQAGEPSGAQGKAIINAVKRNIPGYNAFAKRVRNKIEAHGYVTTMLGRHQAVARDKGYVGIAALAQGTAADVLKYAIAAAASVYEKHGGHMILFVHDEIVAEVPEANAEACLAEARAVMEAVVPCDPPFLTDGVICDNYGEAK
jgi:DNA polymerase I